MQDALKYLFELPSLTTLVQQVFELNGSLSLASTVQLRNCVDALAHTIGHSAEMRATIVSAGVLEFLMKAFSVPFGTCVSCFHIFHLIRLLSFAK